MLVEERCTPARGRRRRTTRKSGRGGAERERDSKLDSQARRHPRPCRVLDPTRANRRPTPLGNQEGKRTRCAGPQQTRRRAPDLRAHTGHELARGCVRAVHRGPSVLDRAIAEHGKARARRVSKEERPGDRDRPPPFDHTLVARDGRRTDGRRHAVRLPRGFLCWCGLGRRARVPRCGTRGRGGRGEARARRLGGCCGRLGGWRRRVVRVLVCCSRCSRCCSRPRAGWGGTRSPSRSRRGRIAAARSRGDEPVASLAPLSQVTAAARTRTRHTLTRRPSSTGKRSPANPRFRPRPSTSSSSGRNRGFADPRSRRSLGLLRAHRRASSASFCQRTARPQPLALSCDAVPFFLALAPAESALEPRAQPSQLARAPFLRSLEPRARRPQASTPNASRSSSRCAPLSCARGSSLDARSLTAQRRGALLLARLAPTLPVPSPSSLRRSSARPRLSVTPLQPSRRARSCSPSARSCSSPSALSFVRLSTASSTSPRGAELTLDLSQQPLRPRAPTPSILLSIRATSRTSPLSTLRRSRPAPSSMHAKPSFLEQENALQLERRRRSEMR